MAIAMQNVALKAAEGRGTGITKTSETGSHSVRDCPATRIARAYAELHRLTPLLLSPVPTRVCESGELVKRCPRLRRQFTSGGPGAP